MFHPGGATNAHDASMRCVHASKCAQFSGCHVTFFQIMTPNIIMSLTFDEVSHATKKKRRGKVKKVTRNTG